jgi:hypothetical protein
VKRSHHRSNYAPLVRHARQIGELIHSNPAAEHEAHLLLEEIAEAYNACRAPRLRRELRREILALERRVA